MFAARWVTFYSELNHCRKIRRARGVVKAERGFFAGVGLKGLNCTLPWGVSSRLVKTRAVLGTSVCGGVSGCDSPVIFPPPDLSGAEWESRASGARFAFHAFNLGVSGRWLPRQSIRAPSPPFKSRKAEREREWFTDTLPTFTVTFEMISRAVHSPCPTWRGVNFFHQLSLRHDLGK